MPQFVTRVILAQCLFLSASAYWFDPQTDICEGGFLMCPTSPEESSRDCKGGKQLQCFSIEQEKEVIFYCDEASKTDELASQLPCNNTMDDDELQDVISTAMKEKYAFDLKKFIKKATPALIVIGSIGTAIIILAILILIIANYNRKKMEDEEEKNKC